MVPVSLASTTSCGRDDGRLKSTAHRRGETERTDAPIDPEADTRRQAMVPRVMPATSELDNSPDARLHRAFDHLISQRASDVVDVADIMAWIGRVTTKDRIAWGQKLFGTPIRKRVIERLAASDARLSVWFLPEDVEAIGELLGRPFPIPERLVDDMVRSEKVRDEVRNTLQETLSGFLKKGLGDKENAPEKGDRSDKSAGLRGAFGLGARALAGAGKGLLGNIGEEVQQQLQGRVRDFVDGSVEAIQERIAKKLRSKETAEALGRHRRKVFLDLLERKERDVVDSGVPHDDIETLVPRVVEHIMKRPELLALIEEEIKRTVEILSEKTLREWLDELDLRDEARASFLIIMRPIISVL